MKREVINTVNAPAPIGPYSQGIITENLIFCAGQIPFNPSTGMMVEGDFNSEARQVVKNLAAVLGAGNSSLDKVIRLDVYLTDLKRFPEVNACLEEVFPKEPPARVTIEVSALPMGARIEMAAIATR
jgi:2-iminobutanoate/2-iminopropanoate deaminase